MVLSGEICVPFASIKCTLKAHRSSLVLAIRFTFPLKVEPERGETKVTTGGVVSGVVPVLV